MTSTARTLAQKKLKREQTISTIEMPLLGPTAF